MPASGPWGKLLDRWSCNGRRERVFHPTSGGRFGILNVRPWTTGFLFISALAHTNSSAICQIVLREAEQTGEIQVTKIVTLGDLDGPGFLGSAIDVGRRSNGEWVVTDLFNQSEVKFYSPSGDILRTIGREGDGPGEFRSAWWVYVLPDDGLSIFDTRKARLTTYTSDLTVGSTLTLSISVQPLSVVPMGARGFVIAARLNGPKQVGLPIHLVDTTGVFRGSFGADPPIQEWDNTDKVRRALAPAGPDAVWTGGKTEYSVERWTLSGERTAHFVRDVPWFQPHDNYGLPSDRSQPPGPGILAMHVDGDGLVWVAIRVPGEHWEDAFEAGRDAYGRDRPRIKDWNLYFDTILEVIDPEEGTVVASTRFSQAFLGLTREGFLFTNVYQNDVLPVAEIWEARIQSRKEEEE